MEHKQNKVIWIGLALASCILATAPLEWLITSWLHPSYQSNGEFYAFVLIGVVLASLCSSPASGPARAQHIVVFFLAAAGLRLLG